MAWWDLFLNNPEIPPAPDPVPPMPENLPTPDPIPPNPFEAYGSAPPPGSALEGWQSLVDGFAGASVSREQAMRVPCVAAARNAICDLGAVLPIATINASSERVDRNLTTQPEAFAGHTRSYSLSWLLDDLFFFAESMWLVTDRGWHTYPTAVLRVPHGRWVVEANGTIRVDGKKVDPLDAIIFRSPRDSFLKIAAPTVRALLALEARAGQQIANPQARVYFKSSGEKPWTKEQIDAFLATNVAARKHNVDGWLPSTVELVEVAQATAKQMMLMEQRDYGVLQVARITRVPANMLSVAVGDSQTYRNSADERRSFVDTVAMPYLKAVEERLSLGDVTPAGQQVRWVLDGYLRPDTLTRYQAHSLATGGAAWSTVNERRKLEDLPPIPGGSVLPKSPTANGVSNPGGEPE
jgi:Phage portal protein